jgi:antirestriction protein ArdC
VAGFNAWRQLERSVKKGEKGIMIFAPIVVKDRDATPSQDVKPNDALRVAGFRTAYVFDVEQTEGRPLPAFTRTGGDPKDFGDKLKAIIGERGIALRYDASIAPADGLSSGGQIRIRPGLSPAEEFSVLAHELAHEILHHGPDRKTMSKVVRETQAEAVAFVVSRGIGLETRSAAADYIALYDGDARTLSESLATIQKTSSQILSDLLPEYRVASAPARTSPPDGAHPGSPDESTRTRTTDSETQRLPVGPDPVDSSSMDR